MPKNPTHTSRSGSGFVPRTNNREDVMPKNPRQREPRPKMPIGDVADLREQLGDDIGGMGFGQRRNTSRF